MPFDALTKMLGLQKSPEEQAKIDAYAADKELAMKDASAAMDDRIRMGQVGPFGGERRPNEEMQGPLLPMTGGTPAEQASVQNAMAFATMGSMGGNPASAEKSMVDSIKQLAAKRAARLEAQGLGGIEQVGQAAKAAPTAEKSLLEAIKEAAAKSNVKGEAADIGKKSMYYRGVK